jgi:hypothetical protein
MPDTFPAPLLHAQQQTLLLLALAFALGRRTLGRRTIRSNTARPTGCRTSR